jgi:cyclohexa-1,5-dienecarbonyl-CoA hydratase
MMNDLNEYLKRAAQHATARVLVLKAEGKFFSAGVDVAEHTDEYVEKMLESFHRIFHSLDQVPYLTVSAIRGSALGGGCELATYCDIVCAASNVKFGQPEIQVGVFPPIAAATLPSKIGWAKTMELLLSGKTLNAPEAVEYRLIHKIWPADQFDEKFWEYIGNYTDKSRKIIELTKQAIIIGSKTPYPGSLKEIESLYLNTLMKTEDAPEGLKAFLEKRKPEWKHK